MSEAFHARFKCVSPVFEARRDKGEGRTTEDIAVRFKCVYVCLKRGGRRKEREHLRSSGYIGQLILGELLAYKVGTIIYTYIHKYT